MDLHDQLIAKIKILNETIWENHATDPKLREWLRNFASDDDRLRALFLLSNFMYFGSRQMREMLKALFRDLYRYPIIEAIRRRHDNTTDSRVLEPAFQDELNHSRFLGCGNPAESGCHLLYYFRQENALPRSLFIHSHQVFRRVTGATPLQLREPAISRYIFIDDFCGSGDQGIEYTAIVEDMKSVDPNVWTAYYVLFATETGLNRVRDETSFDDARAIFVLDNTFKSFSTESRYFRQSVDGIQRDACKTMCAAYGTQLAPGGPLGHGDCELLIGFHHNTPDNTLPIFWYDEPHGVPWFPIFRRYPKLGW